jgi:hypothetical protein
VARVALRQSGRFLRRPHLTSVKRHVDKHLIEARLQHGPRIGIENAILTSPEHFQDRVLALRHKRGVSGNREVGIDRRFILEVDSKRVIFKCMKNGSSERFFQSIVESGIFVCQATSLL